MLLFMKHLFSISIAQIRALTWLAALAFGWNVLVIGTTQAADGTLSSVSFGKIPADADIVVEAFDDSDLSVDLLENLKSTMMSTGYTTSDNGAYILIFEVRNEIGTYPHDQRHILSLETRGGRVGGGQDSKARLNVFDSNTGGLLNQGRRLKVTARPSVYRIFVNIENRASGKTLWQGWASANLRNTVNTELTKRMVPKIVGAIGKTVRQESFSLY